MTCEEKLAAIRARINGEFDNPALVRIGPLSDTLSDIKTILTFRLEAKTAPAYYCTPPLKD